MKKIRKNIFETNSSSTHSISVCGNEADCDMYDFIIPNENGEIIFSNSICFSWGFEKFNDAHTKALYCIADHIGEQEKIDMVKKVISEQTGCDNIIISIHENMIDHNSCGTSNDVFDSEVKLKNFIFNKNSWLFIGNDNSDAPPEFYNTDNINEQYKITIETNDDVELSYKLKNYPTKSMLNEVFYYLLDEVWFSTNKMICNKYAKNYHEVKYTVYMYLGSEKCAHESVDETRILDFNMDKNEIYLINLFEFNKLTDKFLEKGKSYNEYLENYKKLKDEQILNGKNIITLKYKIEKL